MAKEVRVGQLKMGGENPVVIQSMLSCHTWDTEKAMDQIRRLAEAGCQMVRMAVPDEKSAEGFAKIRKLTDIPLVADIHFDYKLALKAIEAGADKIRINPGNIGGKEQVLKVVEACKERGIPIRVGVNSGSLEKGLLEAYGGPTAEALAESALRNVKILEDMGFTDIVVSLKSSNVPTMVKAYRIVAERCDYPLHIGVTEAGTNTEGIIKSAVGLGALLLDGIGDTLRVSLTGDPVQEIYAARKILSAAGLRQEPLEIISCPTCGRTEVDLLSVVGEVEKVLTPLCDARAKEGRAPLKVAVMGCAVNGPGEAREADLGVACGPGKGLLFRKGEVLETVPEGEIAGALAEMVRQMEE